MFEKFRALGNRSRLKIYRALRAGPLCVCEIQQLLDLSQSAVSQHLSKLRSADLVGSVRHGQWTFYRPVEDDFFEAMDAVLSPVPDVLMDELENIRNSDLCDLRDENGNLQEEIS
jgi:ArsR family transcriptional regulator